MTHTFKEVCEFLNEQYNFSKASKSFNEKAVKASKAFGFVLRPYGTHGLRVHRPGFIAITYTPVGDPSNSNIRAIILTHALLTNNLHEPERSN